MTRNEHTLFKSHGACGSTAETPASISVSSFRISAKMSTTKLPCIEDCSVTHRCVPRRVCDIVINRRWKCLRMLVCLVLTTTQVRDKRSARIVATSEFVSRASLTRRSAWSEDNATRLEGGAADEGGFGASCASASRASPLAPLGVSRSFSDEIDDVGPSWQWSVVHIGERPR